MDEVNSGASNLPEHWVEDLTGHLSGKFSADTLQSIKNQAKLMLYDKMAKGFKFQTAWEIVIRDFHQNQFWGHSFQVSSPRRKRKPTSFGLSAVWMVFNAMVTMKIAVLWFGQVYARSTNWMDAAVFFAVLSFAIFNMAFFLWRFRHYKG